MNSSESETVADTADCPACRRRGSKRSEHRPLRHRNSLKGPRVVEEHWTKVLQANECVYSRPCNCRHAERCRSFKRHGSRRRAQNVDTTVSSIFQRFRFWLNSKWKVHETFDGPFRTGSLRSSKRIISDSTTDSGLSEYESDSSNPFQNRVGLYRTGTENTIISDTDDPNYVYIRNKMAVSEETKDVSDSKTSCVKKHSLHVPSSATSGCPNQNDKRQSKHKQFLQVTEPEEKRQPLTITTSCPGKSHSTSRHTESSNEIPFAEFFGTWPMSRKRQLMIEEDLDSVFEDDGRMTRRLSGSESIHGNASEFLIPYKDLELEELLKSGRTCSIYSGRWHGNVKIHHYGPLKKEESREFWNMVTKLHRVRHENIALFMGACVDPNHFAVVLSVQDGISLYDQIHKRKEKMNLQNKIQCLRQVAHGVGYLHAKGIVIRCLSTRNVFMCPKARVSVVDYGIADKHSDRPQYACVPRGQLTYIAPEVLSSMMVVPPLLIATVDYSLQTDVFAFGTLMYEIMAGQLPYYGLQPETIIWKTCANQKQPLGKVNATRVLTNLIDLSWSHNPKKRPTFAEISRELHRNVSLHKQHSISHPENLNRACFL
ncbi:kinase suppressor of Ras 2-like [Mizuhopecten yessoensis]|uniref:Kinase suppressor of Ras 2 n=1 Tax=Mizuhopecten yessoensis TaxID=6573 RepID=A0A210QB79_MIZYE|nr:kinase suppressor of Ras 2-like [Mizuhopecten yessoensis]XP_021362671.1 kinase suppressor of Ras 2-like [Mizuhopecten yessoensis]XP_021362672.1 kinase suppressor of Ras 2-like [Mizuhopecten yessoensis]XP_021362673.1 kinase suppressor of Ras 2-like [Mizuhopecten yessoensis]XP_021362674.1 kinase suppressor of Ras 2-like [Mizuhopecten yessoensis]OWF45989.1 Kinase suppressor of Ras 2 [Mizuhopecten yessoensis]